MEEWDGIAQWWVDAVRDDPENSTDFLSLLHDLITLDDHDALTLDVGCGEGQGMRTLGGHVIGTDVSMSLLRRAAMSGPVVCGRLPDVSWARTASVDRCTCVGVLELMPDLRALLGELSRVTRPGGELVVVMNHPVVTAPDAEPLVDPTGEVLWRWGRYLEPGAIRQQLGAREVVLHHRSLAELLTVASGCAWSLDRLVEVGPGAATIARYPDYTGQEQVPALLGLRWRRAAPA